MKTETKNLGLLIDLLLEGQDESSEGSWQSFLRTRKGDIVLLGEDALKTPAYAAGNLKHALEELTEESAEGLLNRLYEVGDQSLPEGWSESLGSVLSREPEWWCFVAGCCEVHRTPWTPYPVPRLVDELVSSVRGFHEHTRHHWLDTGVSLVWSKLVYTWGNCDPRTAEFHDELVEWIKDESLGRQAQVSLLWGWIATYSAWPAGNREACYQWLQACPYLEELRQLDLKFDDRFFLLERMHHDGREPPEWMGSSSEE